MSKDMKTLTPCKLESEFHSLLKENETSKSAELEQLERRSEQGKLRQTDSTWMEWEKFSQWGKLVMKPFFKDLKHQENMMETSQGVRRSPHRKEAFFIKGKKQRITNSVISSDMKSFNLQIKDLQLMQCLMIWMEIKWDLQVDRKSLHVHLESAQTKTMKDILQRK